MADIAQAFPVLKAGSIESRPPEERWLIRPLWGRAAVGALCGHPKSWKTWTGIEMAVSVASGMPCLGSLPVMDPGPALLFLAEDELAAVRARIESVCRHRGIGIDNLDLHVITAPVMRLDREADQQRLVATLENIRPRMLLLDPLIRLHALDENRACEISGLLSFFRGIQRQFDCAVTLVHHTGKKERAVPGQALRGSSDIYAWIDSCVHCAKRKDRVVLTVEHRAARAPEPMTLELVSWPDESGAHLEWLRGAPPPEGAEASIEERVLGIVNAVPGPITRSAIRDRLRINNQRLGSALRGLEERGRIRKCPEGWRTGTNGDHTPLLSTG